MKKKGKVKVKAKVEEYRNEHVIENENVEAIEQENKKTIGSRVIDVLIPLVCSVAFLYAGFQLVTTLQGYHEAKKEYDALETKFVTNQDGLGPAYLDEENDQSVEHFLNLGVDFASLQEINEDVVGWLYLPALSISYPVVQGKDNDAYLHMTYEGTPNSSGSVFLDADTAANMSDRNSFIYGHNMRDGSMFGSMKKLRKDETLVAQNPYVYYYTKDHAYQYQIFAYYITETGSKVYYNFATDRQYDAYIDYIEVRNEYPHWEEELFAARKNLLTLSTCSGRRTKYRMITQAILVDDYKLP